MRWLTGVVVAVVAAVAFPATAHAEAVELGGVRVELRRGDHWVQDDPSRFYNRLRNQRQAEPSGDDEVAVVGAEERACHLVAGR